MQETSQILRAAGRTVGRGHAFGQARHQDAVQPKRIPIHLALEVLEVFHHAHG